MKLNWNLLREWGVKLNIWKFIYLNCRRKNEEWMGGVKQKTFRRGRGEGGMDYFSSPSDIVLLTKETIIIYLINTHRDLATCLRLSALCGLICTVLWNRSRDSWIWPSWRRISAKDKEKEICIRIGKIVTTYHWLHQGSGRVWLGGFSHIISCL